MQRLLAGVVGFLVLVGVSSSVGHYLREPYNPGFLEHPVVTNLHVVFGALFLALGSMQFIPRVRNRWPAYHRWAGRTLVAVAMIVGVAALFLALVVPFSGWPGRIGNGFFALYFLVAMTRAVLHIRRRNVALHREWMIRAFAIALGIATMRLIFAPTLIVAGVDSVSDSRVATLSVISFMAAFLLHAAVAEFWIRRTRRHPATQRNSGGLPLAADSSR
jgi:uncharacterized membrane protein